MSNLRAGLIGLGMMGRHHARNLRAIDGVDLVAVADAQGDPHGVAEGLPVLPDIDALLEQNLDYVVIAAPTMYHEEIGLKVAEAGVHALIEKPLAKTFEDAQRLVKAFASKGLVGAVGHIERYNPALQELRKRLEAGELGDLYQICTRRQGPFPARIADVGVIKDLASHDIDLTAWVAGSPYRSVSAQVAHRSGRVNEDMVVASGVLANGIIVSHVVNWLTPFKERVTIVNGEKGAFVADTLTGDLTFHANGTVASTWDQVANFRGVSEGDVVRYAIAKREPLALEQERFRDAVLEMRSMRNAHSLHSMSGDSGSPGAGGDIVSMEDGVATLMVVEAVLASAAQQRMVDL